MLEKAGGFFEEAMTGATTIQDELRMRESYPIEASPMIEQPLLNTGDIELQVMSCDVTSLCLVPHVVPVPTTARIRTCLSTRFV